jgi:hypothetical protein
MLSVLIVAPMVEPLVLIAVHSSQTKTAMIAKILNQKN